MSVPREEYGERIGRARMHMSAAGMDGLIVTDPVSFQYFTGEKASAGRPAAFVLPASGEPALINWSGPDMFARVYRQNRTLVVADRRIYPEVPLNKLASTDWGVAEVLVERGLAHGRVGIELGTEPLLGWAVADFESLRSKVPQISWVDSSPVVWACRMIKSEWEISQLKTACSLGSLAWKRCFERLQPGVTQREVQRWILAHYAELGADLDSPPPMVLGATGKGGVFQSGDILYVDGGCSVNGYKMDITRRAVFGPPSPRQRAEHDGMWEILFKVMDRIRPGVTTASIFEFSQSLLAATQWTNYSDHPAKRIGHGIGLTSEPPYINAFDEHVIQEGMSITPEPKIETQEGLLNAEEHVIVRADCCEVISGDALDWTLHTIS